MATSDVPGLLATTKFGRVPEYPAAGEFIQEYLSEAEYAELQNFLIIRPEAGDIIPGSGGVRKLRWGGKGRGKRGAFRVIYYARIAQGQIWMLTMYPKNITENIPAHLLRQIRKEIDDAKDKA